MVFARRGIVMCTKAWYGICGASLSTVNAGFSAELSSLVMVTVPQGGVKYRRCKVRLSSVWSSAVIVLQGGVKYRRCTVS